MTLALALIAGGTILLGAVLMTMAYLYGKGRL